MRQLQLIETNRSNQGMCKASMRIILRPLCLWLIFAPVFQASAQVAGPRKQLHAARGEVSRLATQGKGMLLITIDQGKEFDEVTVLARENDPVGRAAGGSAGASLFGLLTEEDTDEETISAAELARGDLISVIYDPARQNRALELYRH
jgi:hypothetical protein